MRVNEAMSGGKRVAERLEHAGSDEDDARGHERPGRRCGGTRRRRRSPRDRLRRRGPLPPRPSSRRSTAAPSRRRPSMAARSEGRPHTIGQASAEILAGHRCDGESKRDDRHEPGLHDPHADAEAGLRRRAERAADHIDDKQVDRDERELGARRAARCRASSSTARHPASSRALHELQVRRSSARSRTSARPSPMAIAMSDDTAAPATPNRTAGAPSRKSAPARARYSG